jgi:hypothetical protein
MIFVFPLPLLLLGEASSSSSLLMIFLIFYGMMPLNPRMGCFSNLKTSKTLLKLNVSKRSNVSGFMAKENTLIMLFVSFFTLMASLGNTLFLRLLNRVVCMSGRVGISWKWLVVSFTLRTRSFPFEVKRLFVQHLSSIAHLYRFWYNSL